MIQAMISSNPVHRPSIRAVLGHPFFWEEGKQLRFFQDLSDRVEKELPHSEIVQRLEKGGIDVVKGEWRRHLTKELQDDLRKCRNYRGASVRDLLRALRNKRHHYQELPEEVRTSLGSIPNGFVHYFTSRFPRLLIHTYIAVQRNKEEDIFRDYFSQEENEFQFPTLMGSGLRWFPPRKTIQESNLSESIQKQDQSENETKNVPNELTSNLNQLEEKATVHGS